MEHVIRAARSSSEEERDGPETSAGIMDAILAQKIATASSSTALTAPPHFSRCNSFESVVSCNDGSDCCQCDDCLLGISDWCADARLSNDAAAPNRVDSHANYSSNNTSGNNLNALRKGVGTRVGTVKVYIF